MYFIVRIKSPEGYQYYLTGDGNANYSIQKAWWFHSLERARAEAARLDNAEVIEISFRTVTEHPVA